MVVSLWLGLIYLHRRTGLILQDLEGVFLIDRRPREPGFWDFLKDEFVFLEFWWRSKGISEHSSVKQANPRNGEDLSPLPNIREADKHFSGCLLASL